MLLAAAPLVAQQTSTAESRHKAEQHQQKAGAARPIAEQVKPVQPTRQPAKQQQQADDCPNRVESPKPFMEWWRGDWTYEERIGVATFAVTTLFLFFTVLMWCAMLAANKNAEGSNERTRLMWISSERARLRCESVRAVDATGRQASAMHDGLSARLVNIGRTTASDISVYALGKIVPNTDDPTIALARAIPSKAVSGATLPPGNGFDAITKHIEDAKGPLPGFDLHTAARMGGRSTGRLFFTGLVTYRDSFGEYWMSFNFVTPVPDAEGGWTEYEKGNDAGDGKPPTLFPPSPESGPSRGAKNGT